MNKLPWIGLILHIALVTKGEVTFNPYHVTNKSIVMFEQPSNMEDHAYFGYASTSSTLKEASVIVSAPRADVVGKLFECNLSNHNCTSIEVDTDMKSNARDVSLIYKNHHFWLGATLKRHNSMILVCAPLYAEHAKCLNYGLKMKTYGTYGRCYTYDPSSKIQLQQLKIIEETERSYFFRSIENCMDSYGWSADISTDEKVIVGGPAMVIGRAMIYDEAKEMPKEIMKVLDLYQSEQIEYNFGYSVAYGNFLDDGPSQYLAISTPYGKKGIGKVIIFLNTDIKQRIEDPSGQVGSLFGSYLCAAHLDANSPRAQLLVGAPAFAVIDMEKDRVLAYNRGAVHIYLSNKKGRRPALLKWNTIEGKKDGAYFGSAIANIGDLDGDNSDEVAIAAPFEDNGRGAVYIYLGADLIRRKASINYRQRIQSEQYRAFGLSLTTINDYDGNGCNELVVGAPGSMQRGRDRVAVIRCFAWINVKLLNIMVPDLMKRENETYFDFVSCMIVTYPEKLDCVHTNLTMIVKIVHPTATLELDSGDHSKLAHYVVSINEKKSKFCEPIRVLTPVNGEYDTTIGIHVKVEQTVSPLDKDEFDPTDVVLCSGSNLEVNDDIFAGNCSSKKCKPILEPRIISNFSNITTYVIGSTETESFSVEVDNTGDVAYSTCVRMSVLGVPVKCVPQNCEYECNGLTNCHQVLCKPSSRLLSNSTWKIGDIVLETSSLTSVDEVISVVVKTYAKCFAENTTFSNEYTVSLISDFSGVSVVGKTDQGNEVQITNTEVKDLGKHIEHLYYVKNYGPTNIVEVKYELSTQNMNYYDYSFPSVYKDSKLLDCEQNVTVIGNMIIASGVIEELRKGQEVILKLPFNMDPKRLDSILKEKNKTINSQLNLSVETPLSFWNVSKSVTTTLKLYETKVARWIILLAVILGLILVGFLLFIIYKAGCLRRKNKTKLEKLRTEVKRQSMRRSMIENSRRSTTKHDSSDETLLVGNN